ncbi:MAG: DUF1845 domain-containing protein, partial [Burkholderiales bacterium 21-58-4]
MGSIMVTRRSSNMADTQIVKVDQGAVNDRILAKEVKTDFRRVEAASVKMMTHFTSAEAKRLFVRFFSTLQLNAHFVSVIARTKLKHEDVERVEAALRERLESVTDDLNKAIDGAEALFKNNGITSFATYDTMPLELEVGIISSSGRRYFEVLNKLDQLMPLLQTLEIHEVITPRDADIQRAGFKRAIRSVAGTARNLATGLRRRMNEFSAKEAEHERLKAATSDGKMESAEEEASPAGGEELDDGKEQL